MKRFILLVGLSLGLAIGTTACAHKQLTDRQVGKAVLGAAGIAIGASLVMMAIAGQCDHCNVNVAVMPPE